MKTKQNKTAIATAKSIPSEDLRPQIERRAYEIWEMSGAYSGQDIAHWLQAEKEVLKQHNQTSAGG